MIRWVTQTPAYPVVSADHQMLRLAALRSYLPTS
jgi:hypothetical protein